jgi:ribosomal protein S18
MQKRTWRNTRSAILRTSGPKKALAIRDDVFHQLNIHPLHEIYNRFLLRNFVSELGRIIPRDQTGLTWKNQRKLGQAVRRAKAMGIIPVFSKGVSGGSGAKENRVMTSSSNVQNLQKAASEVDNNSIPGDSSLP